MVSTERRLDLELRRRLLGDLRRWASLALLTLVCSSAGKAAEPASANASPAVPTAAEKDTARALARDGDALFAERKFEAALARYAAAYHLVRVPTLGVQVAKTQSELGRLKDALLTAREVGNMPVQAGEPPVFATARKSAQELTEELGARVPRILVEVTPRQAVAHVSIDGTPAPAATSGAGAELDAGVHRLLVKADGYSNVELEFDLHERARERLPVTLFPDARKVAIAPGAPPAAASSNSAPAVAAAAPPAGASSNDERQDRAAAARSARTRGYVALGVAGLGVAAGSVTGVLAFSTKPDCPDDTCAPSQRDEIANSKRYGNVATVSFAVGGAALLYGLWELIANGDAEDTAAASDRAAGDRAAGDRAALDATFSPRAGGGVVYVGTAF